MSERQRRRQPQRQVTITAAALTRLIAIGLLLRVDKENSMLMRGGQV